MIPVVGLVLEVSVQNLFPLFFSFAECCDKAGQLFWSVFIFRFAKWWRKVLRRNDGGSFFPGFLHLC